MKNVPLIFDYNYGKFFTDFDNFCIIENRNEYSTNGV